MWWVSTKGCTCQDSHQKVRTVSYKQRVRAMAPDRRCPSISLAAFLLSPRHWHQHVNASTFATPTLKFLVFVQNSAATSDGRGVVFVWINAVLCSNCLRRSDIKRGFHIDKSTRMTTSCSRAPFSHQGCSRSCSLLQSLYMWSTRTFNSPPSTSLLLAKNFLSRQILSANSI